MTTMLPIGFSEDISVSTTSFRPCARLITLGREGEERGSPSSDTPLSLALLPRLPILAPWSPGLRTREEVGILGWLGRAVLFSWDACHRDSHPPSLKTGSRCSHSHFPSRAVKDDLGALGGNSTQERCSLGVQCVARTGTYPRTEHAGGGQGGEGAWLVTAWEASLVSQHRPQLCPSHGQFCLWPGDGRVS